MGLVTDFGFRGSRRDSFDEIPNAEFGSPDGIFLQPSIVSCCAPIGALCSVIPQAAGTAAENRRRTKSVNSDTGKSVTAADGRSPSI